MVNKHLGEIVIRTTNYEKMVSFYQDVIDLEVLMKGKSAQFFKISDDLQGHPQLIAIFKSEIPSNGAGEPLFAGHDITTSPLHHFAFALEPEDFFEEKKRIEYLGFDIRTAVHFPLKWHSFYIYDPDGNTVEFVCYDETLEKD